MNQSEFRALLAEFVSGAEVTRASTGNRGQKATEFIRFSGSDSMSRLQKIWGHIAWWAIEQISLLLFRAECRKDEAVYNREKLAAWVYALPVEPLEPDEQALGYQRQVKLDYSAQYLERCLLMEVGE